jgi:hypothetical protein
LAFALTKSSFACSIEAMEAIVKFPYDKEQDDELSLKIGDVVTNITTVSL